MTVEAWVATNRVGSRMSFTVEVDDDALDDMLSPLDRADYVALKVHEAMMDRLNFGWEVP